MKVVKAIMFALAIAFRKGTSKIIDVLHPAPGDVYTKFSNVLVVLYWFSEGY